MKTRSFPLNKNSVEDGLYYKAGLEIVQFRLIQATSDKHDKASVQDWYTWRYSRSTVVFIADGIVPIPAF